MQAASSAGSVQRRQKKGRSPSYPGISLAEAEKRARELYEAEHTHAAPVEAIVAHWGYSPSSSGGRTTLAALKKFGLLTDEGSGNDRTAQLSDRGVDLVLSPDPEPIRREAALLPRFHRQMWDEYQAELPSAATLRYRLIREFGFTDSGAEEFVEEYRETITYAGLLQESDEHPRPDATGVVRPDERLGASTAQSSQMAEVPAPRPQGPVGARQTEGVTIPIPLLDEPTVYVSGSFPLTEAGWSQMMRVLDAMKPGLVSPATEPKTGLPPTASPDRTDPGEAVGGVQESEYGTGDG